MPLVKTQTTLKDALDQETNSWNAITPAQVRLYQNNYTPVDTSIIADFTESTFTGYLFQPLTWPAAAIWNGGGWAERFGTTLAWINTGVTTEDIYGYFVQHGITGALLYAELNPFAPFSIGPGMVYSVRPYMSLRNLP